MEKSRWPKLMSPKKTNNTEEALFESDVFEGHLSGEEEVSEMAEEQI